ncbi:hypothetical protein MJT46_014416 [Ovis ammon polii x Ovis aries]|nr:hypothetical protein MJT46_014416 [Ovis ammon polii x Ovis aries]
MNRDSKQKTAFEQQEETPQRGSCRDRSSQGWGSKELYHSASSLAASMQNQISSSNYSAIDMGFLCLEKCSCLGLLLSGYNTGDQCVEEFLEKDEPGEEKGCASRKLGYGTTILPIQRYFILGPTAHSPHSNRSEMSKRISYHISLLRFL